MNDPLSLQVARIIGAAIVRPNGTKEVSPVPYANDDGSAILHIIPWLNKQKAPETCIEIQEQSGVHNPPWLVEIYVGEQAEWIPRRGKTLAEALCNVVLAIGETLNPLPAERRLEKAMKRITPEEVVEAYRKTGLRPAFGVYIGKINLTNEAVCGCAIGALYCDANAMTPEQAFWQCNINKWICDTFNGVYECGFVTGFDDTQARVIDDPVRRQGYADGQAARRAVIEALGPL